MAATLRELRGRIRSAGSIKKITKAQELIATSRIGRAQNRLQAARPYAFEITAMLTTLAAEAALDHPLLVEREEPKRAGVLVVYVRPWAVWRVQLQRVPPRRGAVLPDAAGGQDADRLRRRPKGAELLPVPQLEDHRVVERLLRATHVRERAGDRLDIGRRLPGRSRRRRATIPGPDGILGVDELHIVYTEFKSMMSQNAVAHRIAPMVVEYVEEETGPRTLYSFEPDATTLFDALLPRYLATRVYAALLESAASELASRQRAMKSATDNADDLIKALTLEANRERQAQITQEISEIVGGANALADANGKPRRKKKI